MMMLLFALSCSTSEVDVEEKDVSIRLLRRLSIDLRGRLPSNEEIVTVRTDPKRLDELRSVFLSDPDFETQFMFWMNEVWHTRVDLFTVVAHDFYLNTVEDWYYFNRAVGEEPLRLMAHIVANDLPWTETVTSDYTLVNPLLEQLFPVVLTGEHADSEWKPARYTDGRPPVGVLGTNGLWWRYYTDSLNMNRKRAAAITRLLLCDDILSRPISFEASQHALEETTIAVREDPACATCHSSLDPLASSMFGFYWLEEGNPLEALYYHPEREQIGKEMIGVAPAWYGQPVNSFAEIGLHIAADSRFRKCAVETVAKVLLRRDFNAADYPTMRRLLEEFEGNQLIVKPLIESVSRLPEYQTVYPDTEDYRSPKMVTPYQLAAILEDLTGETWEYDTPLVDDLFRIMAGGVDGEKSFSPQLFPSITTSLVFKRYAQDVATKIVNTSLDSGTGLLRYVHQFSQPSYVEFEQQLGELRWRLHGTEPTDEWRTEITALWQDVYDANGAKTAWTAVLSAMLQDLDFVTY